MKTLDQRSFQMEVGEDESVEDLICKMEDMMGSENLYKLIYAGKMMREGEMLRDYNITGRLPVVVMVTKIGEYRPGQERHTETQEPKTKRIRTESEDSGFGDELGEHFVTDREFTIALEVVMTCQHFRRDSVLISREEMEHMVNTTFQEDTETLKQIILSRIEEVERAAPTQEQFQAFILDIESMYQEVREIPEARDVQDVEDESEDFEDLEEEESLEERNLKTLTSMGFSKEDSEAALTRSSGSLQVALDLLLPRSSDIPPPLPSLPNPLAFLRDLPEFQYLRYLVLRQPTLLKPLLISFGQSHPELMAEINTHKEQFVAMLYEQTGGNTNRHARH